MLIRSCCSFAYFIQLFKHYISLVEKVESRYLLFALCNYALALCCVLVSWSLVTQPPVPGPTSKSGDGSSLLLLLLQGCVSQFL